MSQLRALTSMLRSARDEFLALYREYETAWLGLATSTEPADRPPAVEAIREVYRQAGRDDDVAVLWFDSLPAMALGHRVLVTGEACHFVWDALHWHLAPGISATLSGAPAPAWTALLGAASIQEFHEERALGDGFESLLRSFAGQAGRRVSFAQLERGSPFAPLAPELAERQVSLPAVAHAVFGHQVFRDTDEATSDGLLGACVAAAHSCLWWCPFESAVLLCDRPLEVHLNEGRLHRDGGPAVVWRDGLHTWALNGVLVPQVVAETPGDCLDARLVPEEINAEVRREIVRKIGIERLCRDLGAQCLDRSGDYELLLVPLFYGWLTPYLKMLNPSTGTYHLEGVPPECATVEEALAWRNGTAESPRSLT